MKVNSKIDHASMRLSRQTSRIAPKTPIPCYSTKDQWSESYYGSRMETTCRIFRLKRSQGFFERFPPFFQIDCEERFCIRLIGEGTSSEQAELLVFLSKFEEFLCRASSLMTCRAAGLALRKLSLVSRLDIPLFDTVQRFFCSSLMPGS